MDSIHQFLLNLRMSLHPNWAALATVELPWKTFVQGSKESSIESAKKYSGYLHFQGTEAKTAYEAIINEKCNVNVATPRTSGTRRKHFHRSRSKDMLVPGLPPKPNGNGSTTGRAVETGIVNNITTNSILKAVEQNDLDFLKKHLNSENVNVSDDFGWTPLMSAAYNGHSLIVEFLLQLGAIRRTREKSGLTAAQLALKKNHLNVVAMLKRKHVNRNNGTEVGSDYVATSTKDEKQEEANVTETDTTRLGNEFPDEKLSSRDQSAGFYCEICRAHFKETSLKNHESSTLHIFNTKPKLPSVMYGISKQNKGYQMLLNTGWDEEGGLGPLGEGSKYPLKTVLKKDRKGLGQTCEKEARVTHFKPGDPSAVNSSRLPRQKTIKKRDREKLLSKEARREKALRIALS